MSAVPAPDPGPDAGAIWHYGDPFGEQRAASEAAVVVGYWLTNVLGFILMHKGAQTALSGAPKPYNRRALAMDIVVSLAYTALILALLKLKFLKPLTDYFPSA